MKTDNSSIIISPADQTLLQPFARPSDSPLAMLLSKALRGSDGGHVGLHDTVVLVAPGDPADTFTFTLVLPAEEDLDADRISVRSPVCLAVLGRPEGVTVEWDTPHGSRTMKISAIHHPAVA